MASPTLKSHFPIYILDWITADSANAYIIADCDNLNSMYVSPTFYDLLKSKKPDTEFINKISNSLISYLQETIVLLNNNDSIEISHSFTNSREKSKTLTGSARLILENDKSFIIIKYNGATGKKEKKINKIYAKTNEIARIGGWEVDLINNTVSWTEMTKTIHEVEKNFIPQLEMGLSFYEEGWSRNLITELFTNAVEKGKPFDAELVLITAKGNKIWVRSMGTPVMKNGQCISVYGAFQDITERKMREQAYAVVRERFEIIFNSSPLGIVLVDKDNRLLMANPSSIRIFGLENLDKDQVMKLTYKDLIYPDDLAEAQAYRERLLNREITNYSLESRFYKATGELIWCRTNTTITFIGNEDYLITTQVEDITASKELEQKATANAQRFKSAFDNSPNGMALVGLDGRWMMVNNMLCSMLGYTKTEFLNLTFQEMTHPADLDIDLRLLKQTLDNKRDTYSIEKRYINKSGEIVHGLLNVSLIRDHDHNPLYFISQINDVTKRVHAKKELENSLSELQTLLGATTQVSIIETDMQGFVKKFNTGAENLLGYKAEEVVGVLNVGLIHDASEIAARGKVLSKKYNETIEGFNVFVYRANLGEFDSHEWTYIRKDGSRFPVQLVVTSVRDGEDNIIGYVGIATDISQLKEMEKSLMEEKQKAEAANKSKSEFLANMSHEIRTPLNGVIGFTDLLLQTEMNEIQQKYMQMVNTSAHTLLDLINDILDFSKIEAGKLELHNEKTDLIELCNQTVDIIKHNAHSKGLELLLNIYPGVKRFIYADAVRLRQILVNLLGNAVKFTEEGEVELKVKSTLIADNTEEMLFTFSIRDTGIGIAPQNLQKIFNAFDQEDASTTRKYGGTGLGITISNRLLELMNSKLEVKSVVNKGSTFSFKVQLKTELDISYPEKKLNTVTRVLIVDDNDNNLMILRDMLSFGKVKSVSASNGIEALEILEKDNDFDLIITDYNMPYLKGTELIEHIRKTLNINSEKLPAMLLHSSIIDNEIISACKALNIQFNITKPVRIDQLFEYINKIGEFNNNEKEDISDYFDSDNEKRQSIHNILIAEDNPVNQFLASTLIEKALPNCKIQIAENGKKAVELYETTKFDIIFMDIQMPMMSGFDATTAIRSIEPDNEHIPIIAVTARALKGEKEKCFEAGMDGYITKPIDFEIIKETIKQHVGK